MDIFVHLVECHGEGDQDNERGHTWQELTEALACPDSSNTSHGLSLDQRSGGLYGNWFDDGRWSYSYWLSFRHGVQFINGLLARCLLSCRLLVKFLLAGRVLQNRALDVHFVHEIQSITWPLKLLIEANAILFMDQFLELAHACLLRRLRVTSEEPWILLEDGEVVDIEIALSLLACFSASRGLLEASRVFRGLWLYSNDFRLGAKLDW